MKSDEDNRWSASFSLDRTRFKTVPPALLSMSDQSLWPTELDLGSWAKFLSSQDNINSHASKKRLGFAREIHSSSPDQLWESNIWPFLSSIWHGFNLETVFSKSNQMALRPGEIIHFTYALVAYQGSPLAEHSVVNDQNNTNRGILLTALEKADANNPRFQSEVADQHLFCLLEPSGLSYSCIAHSTDQSSEPMDSVEWTQLNLSKSKVWSGACDPTAVL